MPRNILKWLPAVVVPAVVIAGIIVVPLQAGATAQLPEKSAKQVLELVSSSSGSAFSGTVETTSNLGLPALSISTGMSQSMIDSMSSMVPKGMDDFVPKGASANTLTSALELLGGSHTARIFVDDRELTDTSAGKIRVQLKDKLAERNIVSNGTDAWSYDSQTNTATHISIPKMSTVALKAKATGAAAAIGADLSNPSAIAQQFLARIDPSTTVAVRADTTVAGRSAYTLVLTPKSDKTLVGSISIAVDSRTGLPLKVTVLATGQTSPAFEVALTAVDFAVPASNLFNFTPPAGAEVVEQALPAEPNGLKNAESPDLATMLANLPTITGTGWDSVAELSTSSVPAEVTSNPLVTQLTTTVTGGRALNTALLTIFMTDDGRVFVGSVPLAELQAAAAASTASAR